MDADTRSLEQRAIAAAMVGDWGPADRLEIDWLNSPGGTVEPHFASPEEADAFPTWAGDYVEAARAFALRRHDDGLHVRWAVPGGGAELVPCAHEGADGESQDPLECTHCRGSGFQALYPADPEFPEVARGGAPVFLLETDIDGRILSADAGV